MVHLREIEEAIRELENSSSTYNNCMKLASLYIIRDELRQREGQFSSYGYGYMPMTYERGGNSGRSSYGYRRPMYYDNNEDLMIKKDMDSMYEYNQGR